MTNNNSINNLITEQEAPKQSKGDVWLLVLKDMEDRRRHGIEKYGVPVQPHNGRDPLIDGYQEALDLCVYLRQAIEERNTKSVPNHGPCFRCQKDVIHAFPWWYMKEPLHEDCAREVLFKS